MLYKKIIALFLFFAVSNLLYAQKNVLPSYQPSRSEMMERYKKAKLLDSTARNTVFKSTVQANWLQGGTTFWYRNNLKDSMREYIYVDAAKAQKSKAFDHEKLAAALSTASGEVVDAKRINISKLWFDNEAKQLAFEMGGKNWQCNLLDYQCRQMDSLPKDTTRYPSLSRGSRSKWSFSTDSISPDKKWVAYIKEGNVFIKLVTGGNVVQFTKDGTKDKPYGHLSWSPDSKYIAGYRIHRVKDSSVYYIRTSLPNTTRGQLRSHEYKQPGDPFSTYEMYLFQVAEQTATKVNTEIIDFLDAPVFHWKKDPRYFFYEKVDRGHQRFRIIEVDAVAATAKTIVDEKSNTFIYESRIFTYYMRGTNEILMSSEKDGWRHIYLIDASTGKEKNKITKGNWVVRGIDSVDVKKRELWFRASGTRM